MRILSYDDREKDSYQTASDSEQIYSLLRGERMNIEQIDAERILISLSDKDMESYSVTFESLELSEIHSRKVLNQLLYYASEKTGISLKDKRILIEALKYEHGCLLLLTVSQKKDKKRKTYKIKSCGEDLIFKFQSVESFLACIKALYSLSKGKIISSAYSKDNKYYLIISCSSVLRNKYIRTVREFSLSRIYDPLFSAVLLEYANEIAVFNAVETIGKHL